MKLPRVPIALQQAVMRRLRDDLARARAALNQAYPPPAILYQQRGTLAATAWLEQNQIRLNPILLLDNQQSFIDQVIPHELAHLLVWHHFGRVAPHGKQWQWMMETVLGVPALRTHQYDLKSLARKLYPYQCHCRQHQLTLRRHNNVQRGTQYRCNHCHSILRPQTTELL